MSGTRRVFRAAGYVFTYKPSASMRQVTLEMWREDPTTGERFWITRAPCTPTRVGTRSVALALVAWVRALDVPARREVKAQAVLEQIAMLRDRMSRAPATRATGMTLALEQLMEGRIAAA